MCAMLIGIGDALVGATAIAFSLIMFAMQVNLERMPHGLFRKFSSDSRLLLSFGVALLAAVLIAASGASARDLPASLAAALLASAWAAGLILVLLLYSYRRALTLVKPLHQLSLVAQDARHDMAGWSRRARRLSPLFESPHGLRSGSFRCRRKT